MRVTHPPATMKLKDLKGRQKGYHWVNNLKLWVRRDERFLGEGLQELERWDKSLIRDRGLG